VRPPISFADMLRAFAAIAPKSEDQKRTIAALLGFEWRLTSMASRGKLPAKPAKRVKETSIKPHKQLPPVAIAPPGGWRGAGAGSIKISGPRPAPTPNFNWLRTEPVLPSGGFGPTPDPAPLFRPQWTRAILAASLSTRLPVGPPNIARAVETIARGRALPSLPLQPIPTLAYGVQVLFDIAEGMQPFALDRAALRRDLKQIVSDGGLELLHCAGSPSKTRRDDDGDWQDYETHFPPQLGASVLIVSDFGIGYVDGVTRGASPYRWSLLARRLMRQGHRVVGFVPYPKVRWPKELSRVIHLVTWDRATTTGRISLSRAWRSLS
jgi:hypothetical protein